jgi:CheY-like chemotaxis protein
MLKVLIAEDDLVTADGVEEILVEQGYEVCGIGRTVAEAVELARTHKPDLAVIDLRLADGGLGTDVADELGLLGRVGILYSTGNGLQAVLTSAQASPSRTGLRICCAVLRSSRIWLQQGKRRCHFRSASAFFPTQSRVQQKV